MFKDGNITFNKVYIALGYTDLRYGIDGLSLLVQNKFKLSPFERNTLFLFCGIKSDRVKGLLWEGDGFILLYKRIEDGRFMWPRNNNELKLLSSKQLNNLLSGYLIDPSIREINPDKIL